MKFKGSLMFACIKHRQFHGTSRSTMVNSNTYVTEEKGRKETGGRGSLPNVHVTSGYARCRSDTVNARLVCNLVRNYQRDQQSVKE